MRRLLAATAAVGVITPVGVSAIALSHPGDDAGDDTTPRLALVATHGTDDVRAMSAWVDCVKAAFVQWQWPGAAPFDAVAACGRRPLPETRRHW